MKEKFEICGKYFVPLKERLTPKRYRHSVNVMERAAELARLHGGDPEKAAVAGLIHDAQKNLPANLQLQSLENSGILLSSADRVAPQLWHAIAGAVYAREVFEITDPDILNAVRYHTTGRAGMSLLEKIVYLADLTSADRDYDDVKYVRKLSEKSLDDAMFYSLQYIIGDQLKKGNVLHPDTVSCYNELAFSRYEKAAQKEKMHK